MATGKEYIGINIQYPISELILNGEKTIETRTYPIPKGYVGKEMVLIETPGTHGRFKARIRGVIVFTGCFPYDSEESFYSDFARHRVSKNSPWAWKSDKPKWGWELQLKRVFETPLRARARKGIVFTRGITL